jgi:hypothetical protein
MLLGGGCGVGGFAAHTTPPTAKFDSNFLVHHPSLWLN